MTNSILKTLHTNGFKSRTVLGGLPNLRPTSPYPPHITAELGLTHINGGVLQAAANIACGKIRAHANSTGSLVSVTDGTDTAQLYQDDTGAVTLTYTTLSLTLIGAVALLQDLNVPGDHPLRDHLRDMGAPVTDLSTLASDPTSLLTLTAHLERQLHLLAERQNLTLVSASVVNTPGLDVTTLFAGAPPRTLPRFAAEPTGLTTARALVRRWVDTGLNVLLTGPTATFKTTTAVNAATQAGAYIVMISGRPGLEDRDLFGGVYPTAEGPKQVDGPVTEAFAQASQGVRTVLILNELTRFEPLYLGAMIGALDDVSADVLVQMNIDVDPADQRRYYALRLPQGEIIHAPTTHLSVIGTTNLGSDYVTAQTIDVALLRRFDRHLDLPYADLEQTLSVIRQRCPDDVIAGAAAQLDVRSRSEVQGGALGEGLLARELNPTVSSNLAQETYDLAQLGVPLQAAFLQAAQTTAIPFCVPRTTTGHLDPAALERFSDLIREIAVTL